MKRPSFKVSTIALTAVAALCYWACTPPKREYRAADANARDAGTNHDADTSAVCKAICSGATPLCDETKQACVECLSNETCGDPDAPACVDGTCQACLTDDQCSHITGRSICKTLEPEDAGESSSDAGVAPGSCVQCTASKGCSADKPVCDASTNACVQCASTADCTLASASVCSKNSCVPCQSNSDCGNMGEKDVCASGVCVKPTVVELSLGEWHGCARLNDGTLRCWGSNASGQLGDGTTSNRNSPVKVSNISSAVGVAASWLHSCSLLSDGTAQCWGDNQDGELANSAYVIGTPFPVGTTGLAGVRQIATGGQTYEGSHPPPYAIPKNDGMHSCALIDRGVVYCWGYNQYGQLGTGDAVTRNAPALVTNLSNVSQLSLGGRSSCARLGDNKVLCWGSNGSGQLGNGSSTDSATPTAASTISDSQSIALGKEHACSLTTMGSVECWGGNGLGQVGDGTTTNALSPVAVPNLAQVSAIATGDFHTCALLKGGAVQCWGDNTYGQLGNGTTVGGQRVAVVGLTQAAVAIEAGGFHTCALLNDNSVACWGHNDRGQLGTGNETDSLVPVPVVGL
jgi:alpha-tubulin suppressor-like RCC1 family protein